MHVSLLQKLDALRRRHRRLLAVYGAACTVIALVVGLLVLGLVDYGLRWQDPGVRLIWSLLFWSVLSGTILWTLALPLARRLSDRELALRLERRFPVLSDRLRSAVEFLYQPADASLAGSAELRQAVVVAASGEVEQHPVSAALDPRPAQRMAFCAVGGMLVAAIVAALSPHSAHTAVRRLMNPWSRAEWPQTTRLVVEHAPQRLARGETFEARIAAAPGTKLPDEIRVDYHSDSHDASNSFERVVLPVRSKGALVRRENVQRSFSFRATGGDDRSMPWQFVEVVERPTAIEIIVELQPPPYTGWDASQAETSFRALAGTTFRLTARANRPLDSAAMVFEGGRSLPAEIADNGLSLVVSGTLLSAETEPEGIAENDSAVRLPPVSTYWLAMTARDGVASPAEPRYEVQVVRDRPPEVATESPPASTFVTPQAEVPVRAVVQDDLAIQSVALRFERTRQAGDATETQADEAIELYRRPPQAPQGRGLSADGELAEKREIDAVWPLGPLGLQPGDTLIMELVANDYQPAAGRSAPSRLTVLSPKELEDRLVARQASILAELQRLVGIQRTARSQVRAAVQQLNAAQQPDQSTIDQLQAAELNQRQVRMGLSDAPQSLTQNVRLILLELQQNRIESPEVAGRLERLVSTFEQIKREQLTPVDHHLVAAIKSGQIFLDADAAAAETLPAMQSELSQAAVHQDQAIAALDALIAELAQADVLRRFYRDLAQLLADQEATQTRAAELARRTLAQALADLPVADRAQLLILTEEQGGLAPRFQRIMQQMVETAAQLATTDAASAAILTRAIDTAGSKAVLDQLRAAASHLNANQLGQSLGAQSAAVEGIRLMLDILANRNPPPQQPASSAKAQATAEAARTLGKIERTQAELAERLQTAATKPDPQALAACAVDQRQQVAAAQTVARTLEDVPAQPAANAVRQAANAMRQAADEAQAGNAAKAAEHARAAHSELKRASDILAGQEQQARDDAANAQMALAADSLRQLKSSQEQILMQTRPLAQSAQLAREDAMTLTQLGDRQQQLASDADALVSSLASAPVMQWGAERIAGAMRDSAERLGRLAPTESVPLQELAVEWIELMLRSMQPPETKPQEGPPKPPGECGGGGCKGRSAAEIQLLLLAQQKLHQQTRELADAVDAAKESTPAQHESYRRLSDEQARLSRLAEELLFEDTNPEAGQGGAGEGGPQPKPPASDEPAKDQENPR